MTEDRPYEVINKRKVKPDEGSSASDAAGGESQPSAAEGQAAGAEEMSEEERQRLLKEVLAPDLHVLIIGMVERLGELAWMHMGLVANPATGSIEKDLTRAKLAIDCAQALTDRVIPHIAEEERRELRNLVSNLQINFVRQMAQ